MELRGKKILIISPQAWGKMFLAKHHYAIELAKRGNEVYFLNPPEQKKFGIRSKIKITPLTDYPGLHLIDHQLFFPYTIKFHLPAVYHRLIRFHIKTIERQIGKPLDVIWSFDLGNVYGLKNWDKQSFKIFHPIDEPHFPESWEASKQADIIFSVTNEILQKFEKHPAPKFFINHGVSDIFMEYSNPYRPIGNPIQIGLSGNLTRNDIDRPILIRILEENPEVHFHFWGSYEAKSSNIGGSDDVETKNFINHLKRHPNVVLHGPVSQEELAKGLNKMDAFLIVYDIKKDQSRGTNYHKIMEYLSTGRPIISNNITTYKDAPELVIMLQSRIDNAGLPALIKAFLKEPDKQYTTIKITSRVNFSIKNKYSNQISLIEKKISQ